MAEQGFQDLPPDDRRDALEVAERSSSHKAHLLEKDVWAVATLGILFEASFAEHPTVMLAERTFGEKATAIHVFCRQERRRDEHLSRHWYDLACLDEAGNAARALADRALSLSAARHQAMFFTENDARGIRIDYEAAVSGYLQLVPEGVGLAILSDDYTRMLADGMLLDDSESFDMLMERCALLELRTNETKA